jgi:hypothetical protein
LERGRRSVGCDQDSFHRSLLCSAPIVDPPPGSRIGKLADPPVDNYGSGSGSYSDAVRIRRTNAGWVTNELLRGLGASIPGLDVERAPRVLRLNPDWVCG